MNTIEIGNNIILNHCDDVEEPVMIHLYSHPDYRENEYTVVQVTMAIQIFHTDLKHFDLRKATLLDSDERRPIYGFKFDDTEKHLAFFTKRMEYMMAAQQVEFIEVDGELVVGACRNMGRSLYRLRFFQSWLEHLYGQDGVGMYTKDCEVISMEGGSVLHVPEMTLDDLIAVLKGEKHLAKAEPTDIKDLLKTTVDGVEMTVDEFMKHMTQKAMLERTSEEVMN